MTDYRTLKTNQGLALEAAADTGGSAIKLTTLVVGDGGGDAVIPDARQTALIREVARFKLNTVTQKEGDAAQWVAEAIIPADNGGYTVREVGLLTDEGVLFAVGNFPATYKPRPDEGTAGQLTVTMNFKAQNADNITLMIDGNVAVATRNWVDQRGFVSGTDGLTRGDIPGRGLHTEGDNNAVLYNDGVNGWRALALQSDHAAEVSRAQAAEADIHTAFQAGLQAERDRAIGAESQAVSGTYGLTPGDIAGRALHTGADTNIIWYNDARNGWRALALRSELLDEISRAQAAEADIRTALQAGLQAERDRATGAESQAISGTYGLTPGDIAGRALHTGADTNIIWYNDARNGWRALALRSELLDEISRAQAAEADIRTALQAGLQAERDRATGAESQAVSGTYGLTPGDIAGRALHTGVDTNIIWYNDARNGWRALALRSELLDEISRAKAAENHKLDLSGGIVTGGVQINGALTTNSIHTINNGTLTATYGNGNHLDFQGDGNLVLYDNNGNAAFSVAPDHATFNGSALTTTASFPSANGSPGWCKMPNGLIFQWCYIGASNSSFNLPISFPTAALAIFASNASPQGEYVDNAFASFENNSSFFCATKNSSQFNTYNNFPIYILAIGC